MLGIVSAAYFDLGELFHWIGCSIVVSYYFVTILFSKALSFNLRWIPGLLLLLSLFWMGYVLTQERLIYSQDFSNNIINQKAIFMATVASVPEPKSTGFKTTLQITYFYRGSEWYKTQGKTLAYFASVKNELKIGDFLVLQATPKYIDDPKNPHEFNYKQYLKFHDIRSQIFVKKQAYIKLRDGSPFDLLRISNAAREKLIDLFKEHGLSGKELAIASALVLGDKSSLDDQLVSAYSSAGAMHVLAVSGLHVGFIYMLLIKLLSVLEKRKSSKWLNATLMLSLLWCYAFITGSSPSVLRATTMFSFMIVAKSTKRQPNFFNTLAASAFLLLSINPLLIMEVGFQLSYAAVLGIVIIQPWLAKFFYSRFWILQKMWEISTVSVAAQLGTFPLGLLYFHQFPNYFLISNLFVIPLATVILFGGIAFLSVHYIPLVSTLLAKLLSATIYLLNNLVIWVETLPHAISKNIHFTILNTWLVYLAGSALILLIVHRKAKYYFAACGMLALLCSIGSAEHLKHNAQQKFIVYNCRGNTTVQFIAGNESAIVCSDTSYIGTDNFLFHSANYQAVNLLDAPKALLPLKADTLLNELKMNKIGPFIKFFDYELLILDKQANNWKDTCTINPHYALFTQGCTLSLEQVETLFNPELVVFDGSLPAFERNKLIEKAKDLNINYHDTHSNGALEVDQH